MEAPDPASTPSNLLQVRLTFKYDVRREHAIQTGVLFPVTCMVALDLQEFTREQRTEVLEVIDLHAPGDLSLLRHGQRSTSFYAPEVPTDVSSWMRVLAAYALECKKALL